MAILSFLLNPLLQLEPLYTIVILSVSLSLMSMLATKLMTNQKKLKAHREELKKMQKKLKESRSDPKKSFKIQKEMMDLNMVVMKESFKPIIITMIPFLLVFAWLTTSFTHVPFMENEPIIVSAKLPDGVNELYLTSDPTTGLTIVNSSARIIDNVAWFELFGEQGEYSLLFKERTDSAILGSHDLVIGSFFTRPEIKQSSPLLVSTKIHYSPVEIYLFGWNAGWFWSYIIFSIFFSILFRKLLRVY